MKKVVRKNEVGNMVAQVSDDGKIEMYEDASPIPKSGKSKTKTK